jgi:hypothetical protein
MRSLRGYHTSRSRSLRAFDNKITFRPRAARSSHAEARLLRVHKAGAQCLIIEISCDLMTHIAPLRSAHSLVIIKEKKNAKQRAERSRFPSPSSAQLSFTPPLDYASF